jgi:hypothetical protein
MDWVTTLDQPNPCLDQIQGGIQSIENERGLRSLGQLTSLCMLCVKHFRLILAFNVYNLYLELGCVCSHI